MSAAGRQAHRGVRAVALDTHRAEAVVSSPVAELPLPIATPGPDAAVHEHGVAAAPPSRDLHRGGGERGDGAEVGDVQAESGAG